MPSSGARTSSNTKHMSTGSSNNLQQMEKCVICLEDTDVGQMFSVDGCHHRYCFSCMRQHIEVKLLHGIVPNCPHEDCKSDLTVSSCSKFLTPNLIKLMKQRKKEAAIPLSDKIYCPYPKCSALMSKIEVSQRAIRTLRGIDHKHGARKCLKCHGNFCINCKVPWHRNMTCYDYKRSRSNRPAEDLKLKSLARSNKWRQCVKCKHMIELLQGCYHITCRCGYEFCYNCGAKWKDKKATCSCPLWDERYLLYDGGVDYNNEIAAAPQEPEQEEHKEEKKEEQKDNTIIKKILAFSTFAGFIYWVHSLLR